MIMNPLSSVTLQAVQLSQPEVVIFVHLQFSMQGSSFNRSYSLIHLQHTPPNFTWLSKAVYCLWVWLHLFHLKAFTTNWKKNTNKNKNAFQTGLWWKVVVSQWTGLDQLLILPLVIHDNVSLEWGLQTLTCRSKSLSMWQQQQQQNLAVRHFCLLILTMHLKIKEIGRFLAQFWHLQRQRKCW